MIRRHKKNHRYRSFKHRSKFKNPALRGKKPFHSHHSDRSVSAFTYNDNVREDFEVLLKRNQYESKFLEPLVSQGAALLKSYPQHLKNISQQRLNLQNQTIITIDGEDAKDYDDAVSIEPLKKCYQIGVHIADVSHFIELGGELDLEARKRATSVYLLNRVLPMFPEAISNQLCSLVAGEARLTFSCLIKIDLKGEIKNFKFVKSIIKSNRRCTYTEVEEVLKGRKSLGSRIDRQIQLMNEVRKILHQKRIIEGSIEFETTEQQITLDNENSEQINHLQRKKRLTSEMIIEELMLIANRCAAHLMTRHGTGIYRVHDAPDKKKIFLFEKTVANHSNVIAAKINPFYISRKKNSPIQSSQTPQTSAVSANPLKDQKPNKYHVFLSSIQNKKYKKLFSFLLLTSMKTAEYQADCKGHYGLAFKEYTHFTSPIRRYPDTIAHHIITHIISNKHTNKIPPALNKKQIMKIAEWSSLQERKATASEREYKKVKVIRYLQKNLPYAFTGLIVKIMRRGMYVEEEQTGIEGFLSSRVLSESGFFYDSTLR